MMNLSFKMVVGCLVASTALPVAAQEKVPAPANDPTQGLQFRPLLLEADGDQGPTLGIGYEFVKSFAKVTGSGDIDEEDINPDAVRTELAAALSAKGTIAASKERNPNKFLDFSASYSYIRKAGPSLLSAGAKAKFETDQGFDAKQYVYGVTAGSTYLFENMSFLGLTFGLGRVNPSSDSQRKTLTGTSLDPYQRVEFEGYYKIYAPNDWKYVSDVEFNYRHFQELNPDAAVRDAGLDRTRLGLIRINLTDNLFLQYSKGKLPFDVESARVIKIGWTYKFL